MVIVLIQRVPSDAARCQTIAHPLQPREKSYGRAAALTGLQFRASDKSWIVLDNLTGVCEI
jgi:hypothetical protein